MSYKIQRLNNNICIIKKLKKGLCLFFTVFFISFISFCEAAKPKKGKESPVEKAPISEAVEKKANEKQNIKDAEITEVDDESDEADFENDDSNESKVKTAKAVAAEDDEGDDEDESDEDEDASAQKVDKLLKELGKIKDSSAVIELLTKEENEDLLEGNKNLLTPLIEAYLNDKKPNYGALETYGKMLCDVDSKSQLGNYAYGLGLMNKKKKPNYSKALSCFAIAKKGKKPFKNSSALYNKCLLKVWLPIIIGVVIGIVVVVAVVLYLKKKKAAVANQAENNGEIPEIDLQKLLDEPSENSDNEQNNPEVNTEAVFPETEIQKEVSSTETNNGLVQPSNTGINNEAINNNFATDNSVSQIQQQIQQPIQSPIQSPIQPLIQPSIQPSNQSSIQPPIQPSNQSSIHPQIQSQQQPQIQPQVQQQFQAQSQIQSQSQVQPQNQYQNQNISQNYNINETAFSGSQQNIQDNQNYDNTVSQLDNSNNTDARSTSPTKKIVRVVKKVRVRKDAEGNSYVVSEETTPQVVSEQRYDSVPQERIDLDSVRNMVRPAEKPIQTVDSELDQIWEKLSQKAIKGHIEQLVRTEEEVLKSVKPAPAIEENTNKLINNKDIIKLDEDLNIIDDRKKDILENVDLDNVSIDLSEDSLKDDLIGKLKMLVISESELQELFDMKNPSDIPYLIEYVMTKPEPARLALVAKGLGSYADPAVVDVLSGLLYNDDERVVVGAIQGLEATELPAAIIPLCPFLRSSNPLFAQEAREALSKFGATKIIQALKDLPTFTDSKLKEAGIFVLSRMKGEAVEKIMKAMLFDDSSEIRIQTILAMSYQKNPVYIDSLREFYRTANDDEKSTTRKAIVYLNGFNK